MPLRGQQPAEVVRAATRLHRYHAARQLGRKPHDALPPHPPTQHHTPRRVQPDHAAAVLAQVDPENTNVHCLTLLLVYPDVVEERGGPFHKGGEDHGIGRSRGGLSTKIHAVVDAVGLPVRLLLTPGQASDKTTLPSLTAGLRPARDAIADRRHSAPRTLQPLAPRGTTGPHPQPKQRPGGTHRRLRT